MLGMTKQLLLWFTAVAQYEVRVDDWQRSCWQKDIKTLNVISLVFPFGELWMVLLRWSSKVLRMQLREDQF